MNYLQLNPLPEGAYLLLKKVLSKTFSKKGKYPIPLINKSVQKWNIENIPKLFSIQKKGSKKFRNILRCTKEVQSNTSSWQQALNDASITKTEIQQSHEFTNSKTLPPQFHDKKFWLLCRKTQFNNQSTNTTTNNLLSAIGVKNIWIWTLKSHWFMHYGIFQKSETYTPTLYKHSKFNI